MMLPDLHHFGKHGSSSNRVKSGEFLAFFGNKSRLLGKSLPFLTSSENDGSKIILQIQGLMNGVAPGIENAM